MYTEVDEKQASPDDLIVRRWEKTNEIQTLLIYVSDKLRQNFSIRGTPLKHPRRLLLDMVFSQ